MLANETIKVLKVFIDCARLGIVSANKHNKCLKVIGGARLGVVLANGSIKELKVIGGARLRIVLANESNKLSSMVVQGSE